MTSLSVSATPSLGGDILARIRKSSSFLWWTVLAMLALAIVCVALQFVDTRDVNGVSTWLKPAKFFSSLAIQFATVGWALSYLPAAEQRTRVMRLAIPVMLLMGWGEMLYISFRAARAEASHFNISTPTTQLLYNLMGVGAVLMLVIAGYVALPYAYDALGPYMSKETLEYHHDKHHQAYVTNGNNLLKGSGLEGKSLEEIVKALVRQERRLFNNAGQHYNHLHFWNWMKPNGGGKSIPGASSKRRSIPISVRSTR
jgi:hypothetical protein